MLEYAAVLRHPACLEKVTVKMTLTAMETWFVGTIIVNNLAAFSMKKMTAVLRPLYPRQVLGVR